MRIGEVPAGSLSSSGHLYLFNVDPLRVDGYAIKRPPESLAALK